MEEYASSEIERRRQCLSRVERCGYDRNTILDLMKKFGVHEAANQFGTSPARLFQTYQFSAVELSGELGVPRSELASRLGLTPRNLDHCLAYVHHMRVA